MVLDIALSKDKTFLYSASVDADARSWLLELSKEAKVYEGANRSVTCIIQKGYICKFHCKKEPVCAERCFCKEFQYTVCFQLKSTLSCV